MEDIRVLYYMYTWYIYYVYKHVNIHTNINTEISAAGRAGEENSTCPKRFCAFDKSEELSFAADAAIGSNSGTAPLPNLTAFVFLAHCLRIHRGIAHMKNLSLASGLPSASTQSWTTALAEDATTRMFLIPYLATTSRTRAARRIDITISKYKLTMHAHPHCRV